MSCLHTPDASTAFLSGLRAKALEHRVPLTGTLAVTHRCNPSCAMCYVGDEMRSDDLPTGFWERVITETEDLGCLNLVLTGGEPLLRQDFVHLYKLACSRGFLVTVFTNATRIADAHVAAFEEYPPDCVKVSLYGACADTCREVHEPSASCLHFCRTTDELRLDIGQLRVYRTVDDKIANLDIDAAEKISRYAGSQVNILAQDLSDGISDSFEACFIQGHGRYDLTRGLTPLMGELLKEAHGNALEKAEMPVALE